MVRLLPPRLRCRRSSWRRPTWLANKKSHDASAQSDVSSRENVAVVLVAKLINSNAVSTSSQLEVTRRASVNRLRLR